MSQFYHSQKTIAGTGGEIQREKHHYRKENIHHLHEEPYSNPESLVAICGAPREKGGIFCSKRQPRSRRKTMSRRLERLTRIQERSEETG